MDNHWGVDELPEGAIGFIYKITLRGKWYIGKKRCVRMTKQRKRFENHAWKTYTGSSKTLNADIERLTTKPKFEILQWCSCLSELNYAEIVHHVNTDAIRDPKCYNVQVGDTRIYHARGWWMDLTDET